eukprot:scaffold1620_cov124-Skeletonema_menzelii.AAC.4
MDKYFDNFYEPQIAHYSRRDKTILQIRCHIESLLYKGDFSGVEGVLHGVLFSSRELCVEVITWKSLWEQARGTLLHEVLRKSPIDKDPPESLIRMLLDLAPNVIYAGDVADYVPLDYAILQLTLSTPIKRSLDVIKMLVDADTLKTTISCQIIQSAVWRKDEEVMEYLLSFEKGKSVLFNEENGRRTPLYYASRDFDVVKGKLSSFTQYFIKSCAQELVKQQKAESPRCSCLIGAINTCGNYLYDAELLRNIANKDKTLCCSDE